MLKVLNSFKFTFTAFIVTLMISLSPVVFGEAEESAKQETAPGLAATECNLPAALTDPEVMAQTMADPAKFTQFMALMNNPATTQAIMQCSMDTNQWNVWMANMSDPTKLMNAMTPFMNPQMYTNWMTASMNPQTYQFMFAYMNPALYQQWMTALMNPQFYQPMFKMMDPNWQQQSSAWMMDPSSFQKMFESFYQAPVVADATVTQ